MNISFVLLIFFSVVAGYFYAHEKIDKAQFWLIAAMSLGLSLKLEILLG